MTRKLIAMAIVLCLGGNASAQKPAPPDIAEAGEDVTHKVAVGGTTTVGVLLHSNNVTTIHFDSAIEHVYGLKFPGMKYTERPHHIILHPGKLPPDPGVLTTSSVKTETGTVILVLFRWPDLDTANSLVRIIPRDALAARNANLRAAVALECATAQQSLQATIEALKRQHKREMAERTRLAALEGVVLNDEPIRIPDAEAVAPTGITVHDTLWSGKADDPRLIVRLSIQGGTRFTPVSVRFLHPSWQTPRTAEFLAYTGRTRHRGRLPAGVVIDLVIDASELAYFDDLQVVAGSMERAGDIVVRNIDSRARVEHQQRERQLAKRGHSVMLSGGLGVMHDASAGVRPLTTIRLSYAVSDLIQADLAFSATSDVTSDRMLAAGLSIVAPLRVMPAVRFGVADRFVQGSSPGWYYGLGLATPLGSRLDIGMDVLRVSNSPDGTATRAWLYLTHRWHL